LTLFFFLYSLLVNAGSGHTPVEARSVKGRTRPSMQRREVSMAKPTTGRRGQLDTRSSPDKLMNASREGPSRDARRGILGSAMPRRIRSAMPRRISHKSRRGTCGTTRRLEEIRGKKWINKLIIDRLCSWISQSVVYSIFYMEHG
jgi:hypothetical protein